MYYFSEAVCLHSHSELPVESPSSSFSLPADPTFTLTNVTTAIESVEDWDDLGYFLLVPYEKRGNREEMLRYFITTMPNASWETLAGGLYRQQEHAALETATKFFKPKPGKE